MNKTPTLDESLASLLCRARPDYISLSGGLVLAYTPAGEAGGRHRLCLSRGDGKRPSVTEVRVVEGYLAKALAGLGRQIAGMETELGVWVKKRPCAVIEWGEGVQARLI